MGKRDLSEEDIKARYITPAVEQAGWDKKQIRYEYAFTAGRIILRGNVTARGKQKRADYLLFYKPNFPLAIIEAKDNNHPVGAGLQQAIEYAEAATQKGAVRFPQIGRMLNFEMPWDGIVLIDRLVKWNTLLGPLV